jgi:hypothetical protein
VGDRVYSLSSVLLCDWNLRVFSMLNLLFPTYTACRDLRQPISHPIKYWISRSKFIQNQSVFCYQTFHRDRVSRLWILLSLIHSHPSGVNRLASQICHIRIFRKKLQQNFLHMISTEVSSLTTHNRGEFLDNAINIAGEKLGIVTSFFRIDGFMK